MGSSLHLYSCCGETGTECCFRLQPVVIAYTAGLGFVFVVAVIFYFLLKFNLICPVSSNDRENLSIL
ncbi:unnamed protein product [Gongylonema pulchrum]|uniref:Dolichol phosphate-mannose biosynthesis regulatory protein n=1 Tax=Gongylonema pulchrum TaxID=637853 RepID=A0A183DQ23_9BILA|nr:unnamed protein product [Gongylonema pulchrum]